MYCVVYCTLCVELLPWSLAYNGGDSWELLLSAFIKISRQTKVWAQKVYEDVSASSRYFSIVFFSPLVQDGPVKFVWVQSHMNLFQPAVHWPPLWHGSPWPPTVHWSPCLWHPGLTDPGSWFLEKSMMSWKCFFSPVFPPTLPAPPAAHWDHWWPGPWHSPPAHPCHCPAHSETRARVEAWPGVGRPQGKAAQSASNGRALLQQSIRVKCQYG